MTRWRRGPARLGLVLPLAPSARGRPLRASGGTEAPAATQRSDERTDGGGFEEVECVLCSGELGEKKKKNREKKRGEGGDVLPSPRCAALWGLSSRQGCWHLQRVGGGMRCSGVAIHAAPCRGVPVMWPCPYLQGSDLGVLPFCCHGTARHGTYPPASGASWVGADASGVPRQAWPLVNRLGQRQGGAGVGSLQRCCGRRRGDAAAPRALPTRWTRWGSGSVGLAAWLLVQ